MRSGQSAPTTGTEISWRLRAGSFVTCNTRNARWDKESAARPPHLVEAVQELLLGQFGGGGERRSADRPGHGPYVLEVLDELVEHSELASPVEVQQRCLEPGGSV